MGKVSVKENKKPYQMRREELGLSREKASELLGAIPPASGSVIDIYDTCFRLVESGILDQSFETIVFAAAVFDIYQHTELILEGNILELWIFQLVAECICHSCQAHFD